MIVGNGGREHALAWKLAQSPEVDEQYVAPGNGGTADVAENVPIPADDIEGQVKFAAQNKIDYVIVGPDKSLASGLVDALEERGIAAFGPTQAAARIESSKAYSKELMREAGIPTAEFRVFNSLAQAVRHVRRRQLPAVIKADGLAEGKGVKEVYEAGEAEEVLTGMLSGHDFGVAGTRVVVESLLEGQEVSLHAFSDGESYRMFPIARDHKKLLDGDEGPNTGGMGVVAPVPGLTREQDLVDLGQLVVKPVLSAQAAHKSSFRGVLYPGLMLTTKGPMVLEYNARFGDPEAQAYVRLLESDLLEVMIACTERRLNEVETQWRGQFAASVALVSEGYGYPEPFETDFSIEGLEEAASLDDVILFHAGTAVKNGRTITAGGRVLHVTAIGETLKGALIKVYSAVEQIHFQGMQFRSDIGRSALEGFGNL